MVPMKALQLTAHGQPGSWRYGEVEDPRPGEDEVLVEVRACGLNHLDLWVEEQGLPVPVVLPRIPGGEVSGTICGMGSRVDGWRPGQAVIVQSNLYCGACEYCLRGEESNCLHNRLLGVDCDGGLAQFLVVPSRALLELPARVDFVTAAALGLAGSTAMHMLTDRTCIRSGDRVLVIGAASGVGSAAIQIAKHYGAEVFSTGSTPEKRQLGKSLGADHVVDSTSPSWPAEIRKLSGKKGVDLVLEHVGGPVLEQCFHCLARGGTIVTCGATAGREVRLNLWPLFVKQQRLVGSYGRNRVDLVATLHAAVEGWLRPVVDRTFTLPEAESALRALRDRRILGKAVVVQP